MFQKIFEYAGPHKRGIYAATRVILASVTMGVLPFVLAYQVITPLFMGTEIDTSFVILRVALVLACLVLQAVLYGWGYPFPIVLPITLSSGCVLRCKSG